jgi:hypothetical protein
MDCGSISEKSERVFAKYTERASELRVDLSEARGVL